MIAVNENIRGTVHDLLLPVKDMVGAAQKTENLIAELTHPNIDWKYVITGLRNYLFDYIYDIIPYADTVMPVIYRYLRESTLRKKISAIRACDTFFDRYIFVMNKINEGDVQFEGIKAYFDSWICEYLSLLTELSKEKFYFENIHDRFFTFGALQSKSTGTGSEVKYSMARFLALQYTLYVERAIVVKEADIKELNFWYDNEFGYVCSLERLYNLIIGKR